MSNIILMKQPQGLIYINDAGKSVFDKIEMGQRIAVKILDTDPRSIQQHRWFFAFLKLVYDNVDHGYKNFETFRVAIAHTLGWGKEYDIKGGKQWVPDSFSFGEMKGEVFKQRVQEFQDFVQKHIWKVSDDEIKRMVSEAMTYE